MTLTEFLRVLSARWYVIAAVATLTGVAAFVAATLPGVYWSRVEVVFLAPPTEDNTNNLRIPSENLIAFAAVIERELNGNEQTARFSSVAATLYGAGIRSGSRIELVNDGGQWTMSFRQPVLRVEAVGESADAVRNDIEREVRRIDDAVVSAQVDADVPSRELVTTLQSPSPASVSEVGGSRARTVGGIGLLGVILACAAAVGVDRFVRLGHDRASSEI